MEFIIERNFWCKAIAEVSSVVTSKSTLPILSGINMVATPECLTLTVSNGEMVVEKVLPFVSERKELKIIEYGSIVVSAKYLSEMTKKLASDLHFKVDNKQTVTVQSADIIIQLNGFESSDYPQFPSVEERDWISISRNDFILAVKQTNFAVSTSSSRPILTGVHMAFLNNRLTCAATNSQRMAVRTLTVQSPVETDCIVPSTTLNEVMKLLSMDATEEIQLCLSKHQILFKWESITILSNVMEGVFPNVLGLIPKQAKTVLTLNKSQFLKGIDRSCLFATDWKHNNVRLAVEDSSKMIISSQSSEMGRIQEAQTITSIEGEANINISFNAKFLIDALKAIEEEDIQLSFGGAMSPLKIEPLGNPSYLQVISPVRTN